MLLSGPFPPLKAAYQSQFTVYEQFTVPAEVWGVMGKTGGTWGSPTSCLASRILPSWAFAVYVDAVGKGRALHIISVDFRQGF